MSTFNTKKQSKKESPKNELGDGKNNKGTDAKGSSKKKPSDGKDNKDAKGTSGKLHGA